MRVQTPETPETYCLKFSSVLCRGCQKPAHIKMLHPHIEHYCPHLGLSRIAVQVIVVVGFHCPNEATLSGTAVTGRVSQCKLAPKYTWFNGFIGKQTEGLMSLACTTVTSLEPTLRDRPVGKYVVAGLSLMRSERATWVHPQQLQQHQTGQVIEVAVGGRCVLTLSF